MKTIPKVGDEVIRNLGGTVKMPLKVTAVTEDRIICGPWEFDKTTGAEIDEELGWPRFEDGVLKTGSILE